MVLWQKNSHIFSDDFTTVSLAFFNRYPNPYSSHVRSIDTLDRYLDTDGNMYTTRLIKKIGKLPKWVKPLLSGITDSWVIEESIVNPSTKTLQTYTRNLDHTNIVKVEEYTDYEFDSVNQCTLVNSKVKFSSGFKFGVRSRIENWSLNRFDENIKKSRLGMSFVMEQVKETLK